ncbi:MAG: transcription termination/antitermination protein NusA [Firmicutes bacterium]|nr:transcription termination/antitermination protein NusA [Bacillota bacterium]
MNLELMGAIAELEKERGISKEILLDAIEAAIVSAYKRNYGSSSSSGVRVELNERTGEIHVYARRVVVEELHDDTLEISLKDAQEIDPNYEIGDIVEQEITPKDFGRIAAQTAKQVVIQKIREAERSIVYDEYSNREGDVVTGLIQRFEHRNVMVDLGNVEAILPASEQIPNETYKHNEHMKFYINEVRQSSKGPQIFLSRTHPGLLRSLFEIEVPEVQSGEVEIKAVAREAGNRSKIAVYSRDPNIDPVGACVGARGSRVQAVVSELNNEKIDVIAWVPDHEQFVSNALSPAKVLYVKIDEENKVAHTVVPDDQLSLAIGKEGQNARLAARLTGWRIDIKNLEQAQEFFGSIRETEVEEEVEDLEEELVDSSVPDSELEESSEIQSDEKKEPEKPSVQERPTPEISEEDLAGLTNVVKRKSWQERFGGMDFDAEESTDEITTEEKQDSDKPKRKKKEKVITDLSQLDLIDFDFDERK